MPTPTTCQFTPRRGRPTTSATTPNSDNIKHYIRKGGNANEGTAKSDLFLAGKDGSIDQGPPHRVGF